MATSVIPTPNSIIAVTKETIIDNALWITRTGHVRTLEIGGSITAPTGKQTTIATLGATDRPSRTVYAICAVKGGITNKYCLVSIGSSSGNVSVYNYSGENADYLYGTVSYIVS